MIETSFDISCNLNKSHEYLKSTTRPGLYNDIIDLFTDVYFDSPNREQINLMAEAGTGIKINIIGVDKNWYVYIFLKFTFSQKFKFVDSTFWTFKQKF